MKFVDFKECGSESATKAAGKYMQKGREYVVCDGDILFFKVLQSHLYLCLSHSLTPRVQFNASSGKGGKK